MPDDTLPLEHPGEPPVLPQQAPVREEESGQKLLQFLQRRLNLPTALLHRWIRTGQVRCNGGRCKPFARVRTGDVVRLPPFALKMAAESGPRDHLTQAQHAVPLPELPPRIGEEGFLWAFNKPAGLPVHPGTGHADSLSTRLAAHYADAPFLPAPVHRLDKDTSGVLLAAASYEALAAAQEALRQGGLIKEYVAWVYGRWPYATTRLLRHTLRKTQADGYERMRVVADGGNSGREARCLVRPLRVGRQESLLLVRLLTGRTHQIRAQLAALEHPVLGDGKYGHPAACGRSDEERGRAAGGVLFLHALRVTLPGGRVFACLPPWTGAHALAELPAPLTATQAPEAAPRPHRCGRATRAGSDSAPAQLPEIKRYTIMQ